MASKSTLGGQPVTQGQPAAGVQGNSVAQSPAVPTSQPMNIGMGTGGGSGKGGGSSPVQQNPVAGDSAAGKGGGPSPVNQSGVLSQMATAGGMRPLHSGMMNPMQRPDVANKRAMTQQAQNTGIVPPTTAATPAPTSYAPGIETRGATSTRLQPMSAADADARFAASQGVADLLQG